MEKDSPTPRDRLQNYAQDRHPVRTSASLLGVELTIEYLSLVTVKEPYEVEATDLKVLATTDTPYTLPYRRELRPSRDMFTLIGKWRTGNAVSPR